MRHPKSGLPAIALALSLSACTLNESGISAGADPTTDAGLADTRADLRLDLRPDGAGGMQPGGAGGNRDAADDGMGGDTGTTASGGSVTSGAGGDAAGGAGGDATGDAGGDATGGDGGGGMSGDGGGGMEQDAGAADSSDGPVGDAPEDTGAGGSGGDAGDDVSFVSAAGCSDGSREGFLSGTRYPRLAACAGGWTEPGLVTPQSRIPLCEHKAGNDGVLIAGTGCSAADLCAPGWHVCETAAEVGRHATNCRDAMATSDGRLFFATRQPASTYSCTDSGTSNIIGCGTFGVSTDAICDPLNIRLGSNSCHDIPPWQCGVPDQPSSEELRVVIKPGSDSGGVLCCRG